jgi:hypothetical protein
MIDLIDAGIGLALRVGRRPRAGSGRLAPHALHVRGRCGQGLAGELPYPGRGRRQEPDGDADAPSRRCRRSSPDWSSGEEGHSGRICALRTGTRYGRLLKDTKTRLATDRPTIAEIERFDGKFVVPRNAGVVHICD